MKQIKRQHIGTEVTDTDNGGNIQTNNHRQKFVLIRLLQIIISQIEVITISHLHLTKSNIFLRGISI